jgi:hypothetical protein
MKRSPFEARWLLYVSPASALKRLCILPTKCMCVFGTILRINNYCNPNSSDQLSFVIKERKRVSCETGSEFLFTIERNLGPDELNGFSFHILYMGL